MKNILLPTDFSENSYNAIKYAVQFFKDEECVFYLLNTYTPVLYDSEYLLYNTTQPTLEEVYKENSEKGLTKVSIKIQHTYSNPNHSFRQISSFNMLNDEIHDQVKQKKIDLIIMGTQGATGAEEILFGTHTVHAIKKAVCPVLAIPSSYKFREPQQLLFPTDYQLDFTAEQLDLLLFTTRHFNAKLHILHVTSGKPLNETQEKTKNNLSEKLKDVPHRFLNVEDKSLTEAIARFQEENPTDLLAMINNKHSFFENLLFRPVIDKIGFHTKVPFLVIPSGKQTGS